MRRNRCNDRRRDTPRWMSMGRVHTESPAPPNLPDGDAVRFWAHRAGNRPYLKSQVLMTGEEIEAIVNGYHGDAFGILGPHSAGKKKGQPRWEVRAFLPHADAVAVVAGAPRYEMTKKPAQ